MTPAALGVISCIGFALLFCGYFVGRSLSKVRIRDLMDTLQEQRDLRHYDAQRIDSLMDLVVTIQASHAAHKPLAVLNATIPRMKADLQEPLVPSEPEHPDAEDYNTVGRAGDY